MRSEIRDNLSESKDLFISKSKKFIVNIFKYVFSRRVRILSLHYLIRVLFCKNVSFPSFFFLSVIPKIG